MARLSNYTALPAASSSPIPSATGWPAFTAPPFVPGLAFLTHDQDASTTLARELLRRYQNALMPDNAGNQVQRIVARFALLAAAGEIATLHGITGWQKGTAYEAVQICLHARLNERGHIANQEDEGVLAQIKRFITAHQYSRFASWDGPDRPLNMAGFRRVEKDPLTGEEHTLFFILPEGWREICRDSVPPGRPDYAGSRMPAARQRREIPVAGSPAGDRQNQGLPAYLPHPQYLSAV